MKKLINSDNNFSKVKREPNTREILGKNLFFTALFLQLFVVIFGSSMFSTYSFFPVIIHFSGLLVIFLIVCKIFFCDDCSIKEKVMIGILILFLFLVSKTGRNTALFYLLVQLFGAKNINIKEIFKFTFWVALLSTALIVISSQVGLLKNLEFSRNGLIRYGLGFKYPANLSIIWFLICVSLISLNIFSNNRLRKYIIFAFVILSNFIVYKLTDTRTDLLCAILLAFIVFVPLFPRFIKSNLVKKSLMIFPIIPFIWTLISLICFDPKYKIWRKLDDLFSGRLHLGSIAWDLHYPTLFGQYFVQNGNGANGSTKEVMNYFFIDSSFSRVLFMNGILAFLLFYLILQASFIKIVMRNNSISNCLLLIFVVSLVDLIFNSTGFNVLDSAFFVISLAFFPKMLNLKGINKLE